MIWQHKVHCRVKVWCCGAALTLCWLAVGGWPLWAAPKPENEADPTAEEETRPAATSAADPKPTSVDDDLVNPAAPEKVREADEEIDRLERAIAGMRSAQNRISAADTSGETQKIQGQVVKDLQDILALLKKQQNRQQSQSQNKRRDQNQQQSERQKMQKDQTDPQNSGSRNSGSQKNSDASGDPRDARRNGGKSADSQERTDPARAAAELARRTQMIKDVWGHLPPHVREAMLNSVSEKYLPKYEVLVKKYYEALAEKNRKKTGK